MRDDDVRPDWLPDSQEWEELYWQLDPAGREQLGALLFERRQRARRRAWLRRLPLPRLRPTPIPMRLPLFHAALTFACLGLLPSRPLAMPLAFGLASAIVLYIQIAARRSGYRLALS